MSRDCPRGSAKGNREAARLQALYRYEILDTEPEEAFDDLARLAAHICGTPIVLINFIDENRQWFKSKIGMEVTELPRDVGFASLCVQQRDVVIVSDALADERFATNPLASNYPYVRFYALAPLIAPDGEAVGALCAIDTVPREISLEQVEALKALSRQIVSQLELRRNLAGVNRSVAHCQLANEALRETAARISDITHRRRDEEPRQQTEEPLAAQLKQVIEQLENEMASRARAESALHKEQEFLKALLNTLADGIVACDANGVLTLFNPATRKFHALPQEPIPAEQWGQYYDLYLPDGKTPMQKEDIPLFRALKGETVCEVEMAIVPKVGKARTLLASGQAIFDERGNKLGAVVVMHDITKRKIIEAALFESESRLNSILDSIQDAVWSIDFNTFQVLYLNPATERLHARPRQDFFNNPHLWHEVIHPEDRESVESYINKLLEFGSQKLEYRIIRADGEVRWAINKAWLIYDENGTPIRIDGLASDITDRKLAEDALRQSEARLAEAQKVARVGSWEFDFATQIVTWSEELFRLCGRVPSLNAPTYEDYLQKVHLDDVELVRKTVELVIGEGKEDEVDHRILLPDGSIKYISAKIQPVFNPQGKLIKLFGTALDITDRKQAEEEIRKALATEKELNELKSRFINIASHEFRTPLTAILASAQSLERYSHKWTEEKKLTALHRIQASVKHMTELLNDVLLIAKTEAGKLEFNPVALDLVQFCGELTEEIQLSAGERHAINFIPIEQPSGQVLSSVPCCMDEKLLRHIFSNLLSNAIKYSPPGSAVYFKLEIKDVAAIFHIQDSGIGIPPEDLPRLFEPFHRANNVGAIGGTGLGLAIANNSVYLHGGTLAVESKVGRGTTITVNLPLNYHSKENREKNFSD